MRASIISPRLSVLSTSFNVIEDDCCVALGMDAAGLYIIATKAVDRPKIANGNLACRSVNLK